MPLLNANPDEPFLLEIRYTICGDGSRLDLPALVEDAAVQQVYLCVYLPADKALLGAAGPWTEESSWPAGNAIGRSREPGADYGNALVAWVREGTKAGEVGQFPTDGKLHVYSALRPAPPPEGSLHTVSWNERGLNAAVFLVAIALGVILLPAKMGRRAGRRRRHHPAGAHRRFLPHLFRANPQRRAGRSRFRRAGPLGLGVRGVAASRPSGAMARGGSV